jgi:flagellar biosynthesis protein FlhA
MYFVPAYESRPGIVRAFTLDPRFEQWLVGKIHRSPTEIGLALDPATGRYFVDDLVRRCGAAFLEPSFPRLVVLAFQELPAATEIENAGIIQLPAHLVRSDVALKAAA